MKVPCLQKREHASCRCSVQPSALLCLWSLILSSEILINRRVLESLTGAHLTGHDALLGYECCEEDIWTWALSVSNKWLHEESWLHYLTLTLLWKTTEAFLAKAKQCLQIPQRVRKLPASPCRRSLFYVCTLNTGIRGTTKCLILSETCWDLLGDLHRQHWALCSVLCMNVSLLTIQ